MFVFTVEWDFTIKDPKERLAFPGSGLPGSVINKYHSFPNGFIKVSLSSKKKKLSTPLWKSRGSVREFML